MTDSDLDEGQRRPARPSARTVHDWSHPAVRPLLDETIIKTRLKEAVRLRRVEREIERLMLPEARVAFNREKQEERARAFGDIFGWKISVAGFRLDVLSPLNAPARGCNGGDQAILDREAGLDHLEYYREGRRAVAIVGQPYAPAFECGKAEGSVAEVERKRGIRILELDPMLGWYSDDPEDLPTALVVWTRR
jgi:hypothetical protein